MPQTHLPPFWEQRILVGLKAPVSAQNVRYLDAQQRAEGGHAEWNPLNSTLPLPGWTLSPDYNSIGVKRYAYETAGVAATILTFISRNPDGTLKFGGILSGLQGGALTAEEIVNRNTDQIRLWGTDPNLMLQILAGG